MTKMCNRNLNTELLTNFLFSLTFGSARLRPSTWVGSNSESPRWSSADMLFLRYAARRRKCENGDWERGRRSTAPVATPPSVSSSRRHISPENDRRETFITEHDTDDYTTTARATRAYVLKRVNCVTRTARPWWRRESLSVWGVIYVY